jgi:ATP phosphoribosyltransferase
MGLLVENLKDRVLFAIPKKGRLHEKCLELLAGAYHHDETMSDLEG